MIEAFRIVREEVPDAQLVLAGSMATDDPEGFHYWELDERGARRRPEHPPAVEHPAGRIGADQRVPARRRRRHPEVVARGLRAHGQRRAVEGPARRRRPLRRHHAADRRRRRTATSSTTSRRRADRTLELLARSRPRPTRWARPAASTCATTSCSTRELEDWLRLFARPELRAMIVVSHRGPYRFFAQRRRHVRGTPRRGRRRQRARPAAARLAGGAHVDRRGDVADDDRAPPRPGEHRRPRRRPAPARPRPEHAPPALRRRLERRAVVPATTTCSTACAGRASTAASARRGTRTSR